jgi:hypothetical protein
MPGSRRASDAMSAVAAASAIALIVSTLDGCGRVTQPSPAPDPARQVTPTESTGPIRITFVNASVPPGSTVAGCGPFVDGCRGRLHIVLQLMPPSDGPVLYVRVYLHSMRNGVACLSGQTPPFDVRANQPVTVDVALDQADVCGTPDTMATMDAAVEGPAPIASRQVWSLRYVFAA